jgi:5-methylthioadenosine/S-adenosylhomocysteine deaminase
VDTKQVYYQPSHDPISHVVYAGSGRDVKDVFVAGVQLVKNGHCLTLDEEYIKEQANRMFQTFNRE